MTLTDHLDGIQRELARMDRPSYRYDSMQAMSAQISEDPELEPDIKGFLNLLLLYGLGMSPGLRNDLFLVLLASLAASPELATLGPESSRLRAFLARQEDQVLARVFLGVLGLDDGDAATERPGEPRPGSG